MWRFWWLILCLALSGCQSAREAYLTLIDGLQQRQVQSCLTGNFAFTGGAANISGMGVTATGGATVETCSQVLGGQRITPVLVEE